MAEVLIIWGQFPCNRNLRYKGVDRVAFSHAPFLVGFHDIPGWSGVLWGRGGGGCLVLAAMAHGVFRTGARRALPPSGELFATRVVSRIYHVYE